MSQNLFKSIEGHLWKSYSAMFGCTALGYWQSFATVANEIMPYLEVTDAPYHNADHTLQVMLVGQTILEGRYLQHHDLTPQDWLNVMVALLCHDIGYVRGICPGDDGSINHFITGQEDNWVTLTSRSTDASLTPYHVGRGQRFVRHRLAEQPLIDLDTVVACIEHTRFPVPPGAKYQTTNDLPGLCRAADLLGQLSDPDYLKKLSSLFCEFAETGTNAALGYESVADLRANYPHFYWYVVYPFIQAALRYLAVTAQGREVIARLFTNVYLVELEQSLSDAASTGVKQQATGPDVLPFCLTDNLGYSS
ncbi:metal-dependent phosphohydrolase [Leptolyngbya sp. CCNP1308]|uniref:metal-dependent phosphohydrolase n=1 Tax=Leptolyngbya sp. CCNP1308 TaxID=3110255 RepID=UPI002B1FBFD4|nr:metal-dependent phosphohydrolase [Leptolyngbya sp. CCNP1308]MEA5451214.1 metal-dependent phosphohydrolase [Leptolyngbya sp. CCNP1308]